MVVAVNHDSFQLMCLLWCFEVTMKLVKHTVVPFTGQKLYLKRKHKQNYWKLFNFQENQCSSVLNAEVPHKYAKSIFM